MKSVDMTDGKLIDIDYDEYSKLMKLVEIEKKISEINKTLDGHWFTRLVMKIIRWTS